jgi:hypothetical protein
MEGLLPAKSKLNAISPEVFRKRIDSADLSLVFPSQDRECSSCCLNSPRLHTRSTKPHIAATTILPALSECCYSLAP